MEIRKASFVLSSTNYKQCPPADKPEFAFIGRSNVGKSSLINYLVHQKSLAKTSGRPGKTQLINHFLIDDTWYMVDLPGYGYAQVSKGLRRTFKTINTQYILNRTNLYNLFVLIDVRHSLQKIDLEFMQWLGEHSIPFSIIFTKADKLSTRILHQNIEHYKNQLLEFWEEMPPYFISSASTKTGKEAILDYVHAILSTIGSSS